MEQLVEDGFATMLLRAAEVGSALGECTCGPSSTRSPARPGVPGRCADRAILLIRWGRLIEVTFWSTLEAMATSTHGSWSTTR
ncbi:hypothetical protein [Micromonospora sp. RP3T]|uniref:hypothetical protein n=1 Tax=Micromonospora sp. RP3T TaxID=2135446 RepID=UPI003D737E98